MNSAPAYLVCVAANINAEQSVPQAEIQPEFTALGFEDVKFLMMDTLQRHCGLMAKQLIQRILQAQEIPELKTLPNAMDYFFNKKLVCRRKHSLIRFCSKSITPYKSLIRLKA